MFKLITPILLLVCVGNGLPQNPKATPTVTDLITVGFNPPSNFVQPLDQVVKRLLKSNPNYNNFRNFNWDQIFANNGKLSYCVRWDSPAKVTVAQRDAIHAALKQQVKKWIDVMVGQNGWPFPNVPVSIVGWAVRDRSQLQWTDSSVDIYVNDINENAPQCSEKCGRFFNQDGNYSNCPGGASRHYDQSLWLTAGLGGGAGGDWGQRIGSEYMLSSLNSDDIHILLHEIGHTFGLDDFYDFSPISSGFLMKAGSALKITDFDTWMLRDTWRRIKSRYNLSALTGNSS